MKSLSVASGWRCALVLVLAVAGTSIAAKPAAEEKTGLKVGEKAPGFRLKDQKGAEHTLEDLLKQGKVALVFYRSADW
jgi:cytochrome oxidase Cu insertion factor (SCO1/SenC/PrrC family)